MNPIERWIRDNEVEHGHYAAFVGFEKEIRDHDDGLQEVYDALDITEKIALYGLICKLIDETEGKP